MNASELLAWGSVESATRKAELAAVRSAEDLKLVQRAAEARRKAVGLSRSQAASAVSDAQVAAVRQARGAQ